MPRQKTGRPLGRPPLYSDEEKPLTISLRVPRDLAEQGKHYAARHRQSMTELLLDGLRWRIEEGDPHGDGTTVSQHTRTTSEYYSNTETSCTLRAETADPAILREIRAMLAAQATQLSAIAQAMTQGGSGPVDKQYLRTTAMEQAASLQAPPIANESPEAADTLQGGGSPPPAPREGQLHHPMDTAATLPPPSEPPGDVPGAAPQADDGRAFDPTRFVLGKLCPRKHAWRNTGQSLLRLPSRVCPHCDAERAREKRRTKRQAAH